MKRLVLLPICVLLLLVPVSEFLVEASFQNQNLSQKIFMAKKEKDKNSDPCPAPPNPPKPPPPNDA